MDMKTAQPVTSNISNLFVQMKFFSTFVISE